MVSATSTRVGQLADTVRAVASMMSATSEDMGGRTRW
jgi:hypothetical protein